MFQIFFLFLFCSAFSAPNEYAIPPKPQPKCGYESCHKTDPKKLNVHLVPHSHDDVGWKRTVDQYFYGNNEKDHPGIRGVEDILNSVVQSLNDDSNRRFIQAETVYFARWWDTQTDDIKTLVRQLVDEGRLEMVGGGWSMNDEAAANYQSIIDQMTLGLQTLEKIFGKCGRPRIGWQIDPFGHTNAMATILAEIGFDGVFFWRLDYRDYAARHASNRTEFVWRGNSDRGENSEIFTSMLYENYNAPLNFCWDIQCGDQPIIDDKSSAEYNVKNRVDEFYKRIQEQAEHYKTNNILITMGGDFTYQAAEMYYINIDRLIKGFQEFYPESINMIYSTPSCYIKAVHESAESKKITFSLEKNDFIPYATDKNTYWTGYYSSRPNSKRFERQGNNLLQVAKHLVVFENAKNKSFENNVVDLKEAVGIMQHHDAITGTEKQHVADDYVRMLTKAMNQAQKSIETIIFDLLKFDDEDEEMGTTMNSCLLSNVSRCAQSGEKTFIVAVYNPHGQVLSHYVRIPVVSTNYSVAGLHGGVIPVQISPAIDTFDKVPGNPAAYELTFYAKDLPPLGVNYFYVMKNDQVKEPNLTESTSATTLGTETTGIEIDSKTGLLKAVKLNGVTQTVTQQFLYYKSSNATSSTRASGAYIFRPLPKQNATVIADSAEFKTYKGEMFDEVHQKFTDWLKQVVRVYKNENYIEFDWVVGPLNYVDKLGIEVITRYTTDLKTAATFYTDSNGRELIKRVRNYRPTYQYTNEEPISGNYYPITSRIVIKDESKKVRMAILNDRAQGGSSLNDGEVELMLHRRLMNDDEYGVDEVLNEREFGQGVIVRGQHYLMLGSESGAVEEVKMTHKLQLAPWSFIGNFLSDKHNFNTLRQKMNFQFSGLTRALPENVRLLTLEYMAPKKLLLRLENPFGASDDKTLGAAVTVDLKGLLTLYTIKFANETTLGSNQPKSDNERLQFPIDQTEATLATLDRDEENNLEITLKPMQIRTFVLDVEPIPKLTRGGASNNLPYAFITLLFATICLLR